MKIRKMSIEKLKLKKILFFRIVVLVMSVAVVPVIAEVYLRFFHPQDLIITVPAKLDPEIIYTLTPNTRSYLRGTSVRFYHLNTNSIRLREREIPFDKPSTVKKDSVYIPFTL